MMTIHPENGPQDTVRGEARTSDGSHARYVRSEPLGPDAGGPTVGGVPGMPGMPSTAGTPMGGFPLGLRIPRKSVALAGLLALVLGPLGMVYATFLGAFVMAGTVFWTAILHPAGLPVVWLLGVAWAMWAAYRRNQRVALFEARMGA